jgi:hypothetical protein
MRLCSIFAVPFGRKEGKNKHGINRIRLTICDT